MSPPTAAEAVVEAYSAVIDTVLVKVRTVIVSSVYPGLTTNETTSTIGAGNAGLVSLCDGSVSDGYLQRDGVHLTTTAINRVAKNLAPKVKCAQSVVCGQVRQLPPRQQQLQERRRHCATTRTAMPTTRT